MGNLGLNTSGPFRYLEDARKQALSQPGHEAIVQNKDGTYAVQPLVDEQLVTPPTLEILGQQRDALTARLQTHAKASAAPVLEFILEEEGLLQDDRRFTVADGVITESKFRLNTLSDAIRSPEQKGLEILREALEEQSPAELTRLTPVQINALLSSQELTAEENAFATTHLNSAEAQKARATFTQFFGADAALSAAGVADYPTMVTRLNQSENRENLARLATLAKYPESFQDTLGNDSPQLVSLAKTLQELPGARRAAHGVSLDRQQQRSFDNALRTLDHYKYKFKVTTGMQFNQQGVAYHNTEANYRWGGSVITVGLEGKNFDFNSPIGGVGYGNQMGDVNQRVYVGYSSGNFDIRTSVAQDNTGKMVFERPESQSLDRYIARKGDDAKDWLLENKGLALGIGTVAVGAAYAYSKANPDKEISTGFSQRFNIYENEFARVRGSVTPDIILRDGKPDLGLKEAGIGVSGNVRDHSYDANLVQRFENTSLGSGKIDSRETELNLRYGYRAHSVMLDNRFSYDTNTLQSQLAYRHSFTHSATTTSFVQPYVRFDQKEIQATGVLGGMSKDFGKGFKADVNVGYDQQGGATGGFRLSKQF